MDRRRFLKYASTTAAVVGASALGFDCLVKSPSTNLNLTTITAPTTIATTSEEPSTTEKTSTIPETPILKKGYPRLGNYYHIPESISQSEAEQLAKWDIVVLNSSAGYYSPNEVRHIRTINPNTKILVWVSVGLWPQGQASGYLCDKVNSDSSEDWWVHKNGSGSIDERRLVPDSNYPSLILPNPKSEWATNLLKYLHEDLMSIGTFDGVFYDACWYDSWFSSILQNTDISIEEYRDGVRDILKETRIREGSEAIILGNPGVEWGSESSYWSYANGHYQENALGNEFGIGWPRILQIYEVNMTKPSPPSRIHWIGVDVRYNRSVGNARSMTQNDLSQDDLRRMRFGLGITLLDDGYFGFDKGDGLHGQLWRFPEYDANLGLPRGKYELAHGVFGRDYENGMVLVNPGAQQTIELDGRYRDMTTNRITQEILVPSNDARILAKA